MGPATVVFALAPPVGLMAFVVVHVLVSRLAPALPRPHGIAVSGLVGLGVVAGMGLAFAQARATALPAADRWGAVAVWILAYLCLAYSYVFGFFNLGESARRIRLLIELRAAGARGLTLEEILTVYSARMIVEARLARLLSTGQLRMRAGRYVAGNPLMLCVARLLVALKLVVLGARSEFGAVRR